MSSRPNDEADKRILVLETEVRALEQQLAQRERALATLNRRLMQLERPENGVAGSQSVEARPKESVEAEAASLREELKRMRNTRLFRWSRPARKVYAAIRGPL